MRFAKGFRRSELSWPENLRQQVTPLIVTKNKWFGSPKLGVVSLRVLKQIS